MSAERDLAVHQFDRALEILGTELAERGVSPRQRWVNRCFSWTFVSFFVGYALVILGAVSAPRLQAALVAGSILLSLSLVAMILLFFLNLGLVVKLWRLARMRRRLGLSEPLASAFKARRRRHRLLNIATGTLGFIGGILLLSLPVYFILEFDPSNRWFIVVAVLFLGVSFVSLHLVRREIDRLDVVEETYSNLKAARPGIDEGATEQIKIPEGTYDMIAKLERDQIIRQRQASIQSAAEHPDAFGYSVQISFTAQEAKDRLPLNERAIVDEEILKLLKDPDADRDRVIFESEGDHRRLSVPGTSAEIRFRVDEPGRRIQISRIESSDSGPGGSGMEG